MNIWKYEYIFKMDLTNIVAIKTLCQKYKIHPQRQSGQNFLIDKDVLNKTIEAADLKLEDTVLEVGAGFGTITQKLAQKVKRVIAVEMDKNIINILRRNIGQYKNVEIINKDILKLNLGDCGLRNSEYKVVANLPYNITSRFIRNFLSLEPKSKDMTLITQREAADRICAAPACLARKGGGNGMSLLSVSVQFYAKPEIAAYIKPESFWPAPAVESALIKIANIKARVSIDEKKFFKIAKIGFSARRKMLKNNLGTGLKLDPGEIEKVLESIGLAKTVRPQDLGVEHWLSLARKL